MKLPRALLESGLIELPPPLDQMVAQGMGKWKPLPDAKRSQTRWWVDEHGHLWVAGPLGQTHRAYSAWRVSEGRAEIFLPRIQVKSKNSPFVYDPLEISFGEFVRVLMSFAGFEEVSD